MRLLLVFLLLPTLAAASPWRAIRKLKAKPAPAHTVSSEFVDTLTGLQNAPAAAVTVSLVRKTGKTATILVFGSAPKGPSAGGIHQGFKPVAPGVAALVRVPRKGAMLVLDTVELPPPQQTELTLASATHLDGDKRRDAVYRWRKSANGVQRFGALIARGDTVSNVELGSDARPRAAIDVTVACFAPVVGSDARALLVGRRAVGRSQRAGVLDSVEALLPGPDGRYAPRQLFGAAFAEHTPEAEARRAWIKAFRPRPARISAQVELGRCPAEGIVLPARALRPQAAADTRAVLGPFALQSSAVRARLAKLRKRVPQAMIVLGVGG